MKAVGKPTCPRLFFQGRGIKHCSAAFFVSDNKIVKRFYETRRRRAWREMTE